MKKKALTLCVATILGLSSGTVAMAATIDSAGGTDSHAVYGTYQLEGAVATVYSVDVSWGDSGIIGTTKKNLDFKGFRWLSRILL